MKPYFKVISPINNSIYIERDFSTHAEIDTAITNSVNAQKKWQQTTIVARKRTCLQAVDSLLANIDQLSEQITWQMGRPIRYTPMEINGFAERAHLMIDIAANKLNTIVINEKVGFKRFIKREPLGVIFTIAPWNYPYLTAVNSIISALMAGNSVILKPSSQTPLSAESMTQAFANTDLPSGVFQHLFLTHEDTSNLIKTASINYVAFTGSVAGGKEVEQASAGRFIDVGLELGGKDPAYVRADADIEKAIENLADGAYFNSGQSCCGIERIYLHEYIYDDFIDGFVSLVKKYILGNPLDKETTLGPVVNKKIADNVYRQISDAISRGANSCINPQHYSAQKKGGVYITPQVLMDVDHTMQIMTKETFGPAVGIMKVKSDDQAIAFMNDSSYGLTASVWTEDVDVAVKIGDQVNTGTWFMNRCDYLDPQLAWTGIKNSGKGCTLSEIGYEKLTRPKSYHLKTAF